MKSITRGEEVDLDLKKDMKNTNETETVKNIDMKTVNKLDITVKDLDIITVMEIITVIRDTGQKGAVMSSKKGMDLISPITNTR